MLTTRNQRARATNVAAALAGTIARRAVDQLTTKGVNAIGEYLSGGRQANMPKTEYRGGAIASLRSQATIAPRASKKKRSRRRNRNQPNQLGIPGSPPNIDRIVVTLRDVIDVLNTSTGVLNQYYQLACVYTAGQDMRTWLPRAGTTLTSAFRFFRIRKACFSFQSTLAYTSTGYIVLAVDPAPDVTTPGSLSASIRHDPSVMGDVKDSHEMIWSPRSNRDSLDHLTNTQATVTAPEDISQGTIQLYSNNSEASAARLGLIAVFVEIEFYGLL